jgi:hypothetical protein
MAAISMSSRETSGSASEALAPILRLARKAAGPEAWNAGACALTVLAGWAAIQALGPALLNALAAVPVNLVEVFGCGLQAVICLP